MPTQRARNIGPLALLSLAVLCLAGLVLPPVSSAQTNGPVRISLDQAIQMALTHNHALLAARTTILQSQAQEITAGIRPNPVIAADYQFIPAFTPSYFGTPASQVPLPQEFDVDASNTFELGRKRHWRIVAARDQTAVTQSAVADNERNITFQTASQFITAQLAESTLDLAQQDLKTYQQTVDLSELRYRAGDISQGDYLKIKLQLLQFQSDLSQAQLAKVQALSDLRQLLGYESVPADYDVSGDFEYQPVKLGLDDLQVKALQSRPDLRAAQQGITVAQSQFRLAKANGVRDLTAGIGYSQAGGEHTLDVSGSIELPIFDRNQGEIARTRYAISQSQEQEKASSGQVLTDVRDAYEGVRSNDQILSIYRSGYLDEAKLSRDISEYAYKRGAVSLLDFLDAERSYRATELAYRQALASYLTAVEQLREAVGVRNLP
jgi:outer membrane protein, heavy metal efflux system